MIRPTSEAEPQQGHAGPGRQRCGRIERAREGSERGLSRRLFPTMDARAIEETEGSATVSTIQETAYREDPSIPRVAEVVPRACRSRSDPMREAEADVLGFQDYETGAGLHREATGGTRVTRWLQRRYFSRPFVGASRADGQSPGPACLRISFCNGVTLFGLIFVGI